MGASRRVAAVKTGTIHIFAMVAGEPGYLRCNGDAYNVADKPRLFAKIGYTFGGAGAVFNVPEMRGEGIRGLDEGRGVDAGRVLGSWQDGQMTAHTHSYEAELTPTSMYISTEPGYYGRNTGTTGSAGGTHNGGENRMRNMAYPFAIKD